MHLHLDGSQGAAIENLANHAASLEKEVVAGKALRQLLPHLIDVNASRFVTPVKAAAELDAQESGVGPVVGRVDGGPA